MRVARILAILSTVLASAFLSVLPAGAQTYQGNVLVTPSLVVDAAPAPGRPLTVGLFLRMAKGWHTYWKYSGDAGIPTEIKWDLPSGWSVGEIEWPIPLKLKDPGDIVTYGYSDEVLLIQKITPPANFNNLPVKVSAEANWLVCERLCIPGSAKLEVTLPPAESNPENSQLFDRFRKRLPASSIGSGGVESLPQPDFKRAENEITIHFKNGVIAKYDAADFFPLPDDKTVVGHASSKINGDELTIQVPFETAPPEKVAGLVTLAKGGAGNDRVGWYLNGGSNEAKAAPVASLPESARGLWTFLFFGFIGGFILNLMPCVLPVISLKIFGFVKQAGQDRQRIFRSGLAFVAGIFAWFLGLGAVLVGLKMAGHQITWALQFTNPYFVLGMSVIVLVFALDLFGVFEIALPQWASRGMLSTTDRQDDLGSFLQGVFATVLATPCTAPFLGTALGFAFTQSALVIVAMFVAIAAGMSAPYLLLSAQPAWLRFLPKPGPWMQHVKQFMGFLLIATVLFLLYVLGAQRGYEALIWASCFLLVISMACWIKGTFAPPTASLTKRAIAFVAIVALVVAGGAYFIGERFRASGIVLSDQPSQGGWQNFTPERLQSEIDQGRPVFVDFTAAWCITCKFNEKSVLESDAVRDAFQRHGIVKFKADWTNGDPAITKLLQHFGRPGVPLYVLYPGKSVEPVVFPELLTKSIILDKLETISQSVASKNL